MSEEMKIPTMLTIEEASKRTGLSQYLLRKMVWENKITHIKSGNKYLINFEKLIEYLNYGE